MKTGAVIARVGALLASAAALTGGTGSAHAQAVEYFGTPWIYQPVNVLPGQSTGTGPAGASLPQGVQSPTAYSNIFGFATQVGNPTAPPWLFVPRFGVNEIATDNVRQSYLDRQEDLTSQIFGGVMIGADTSHLTGILDYSGVLQENINATDEDRFTNYGFLSAHATILPGTLLADIHGSIDDVLRPGGGVGLNPTLLQNGQVTQSYLLSASPYYVSRLGDIGFASLRYQVAQAWFSQNADAITIPGLNLGPITSSTEQQARLDVKLPGTFVPRLATHISLSAGSEITGLAAVGTFLRSSNQVINEYEAHAVDLSDRCGWLGMVAGSDIIRWSPDRERPGTSVRAGSPMSIRRCWSCTAITT